MTESEAATKINFFRMQTVDDYFTQKLFSPDLGERRIKANHDCQFDSQNAQGFELLIEGLQ